MLMKDSISRKVFNVFNYSFLILLSLFCILPMINVLAISFSSGASAAAGVVKFWPVDFTLKSYIYVATRPQFISSMWVSVQRVLLGTSINMLLTILVAYPLSKEKTIFRSRSIYAWYFFLTILFSGGLIPWYITISSTGLIDTIWALILPGALPVFNMILLLNFFRQLPKELDEAGYIDGASHSVLLWKIYVPLSKPALATISLFCIVGHWNNWFDGLILMNRPEHYPLQSYLQTVVLNVNTIMQNSRGYENLSNITDRTTKAAQIFIATIPILLVYPYLQKYFTTGIVLGSVKG